MASGHISCAHAATVYVQQNQPNIEFVAFTFLGDGDMFNTALYNDALGTSDLQLKSNVQKLEHIWFVFSAKYSCQHHEKAFNAWQALQPLPCCAGHLPPSKAEWQFWAGCRIEYPEAVNIYIRFSLVTYISKVEQLVQHAPRKLVGWVRFPVETYRRFKNGTLVVKYRYSVL